MRWWCGLLGALLALLRVAPAAGEVSIVLADAASGEILRAQNADVPRPPGAFAQLMVVLISLEEAGLHVLPLDVPVTISATAAAGAVTRATATSSTGSNVIRLQHDKTYLLSDLLKAMLVGAPADAAVAAAEAIAGSVPACLDLMNARAQKLGLAATHFGSIGGVRPLPSAPDVTTARDLVRLAGALLRYPQVTQWSSLSGLPFAGGAVLLRNVNQLLGRVAGADGLQISSAAGAYDVVATARRGPLRLVAVVLGAPQNADRYRAAADLLEWGFAQFERVEVVREGEPLNVTIPIRGGTVTALTPVAGRTFSLLRRRGQEEDLQVRYQLPPVLAAPVGPREPIGEVIVEAHNELLAVIPVVSPVKIAATGVIAAALR